MLWAEIAAVAVLWNPVAVIATALLLRAVI